MATKYIGITDFTDYSQVEEMLSIWRNRPSTCEHKLHVGVMMSRKTLNGLPTKWASAFPSKENIKSIFVSEETFNCLHYADYDNYCVEENIADAVRWAGFGMTAIQLDMIWPDVDSVAQALIATAGSRHELEVILQLNEKALLLCDKNPETVANRLSLHQEYATHVLFDLSMGRGERMKPEVLMTYARVVKDRFPDFGLVFAGGLGPETADLIDPILEEFPDCSVDAQGQLRKSGSALDPIDWDRAGLYLEQMINKF